MSSSGPAYEFIRKMATDPGFFGMVMAAPDVAIQSAGITDPADVFVVRSVISAASSSAMPPDLKAKMVKDQAEMLDQYRAGQKSTMEVIEGLKGALKTTLKQIDEGFKSTKLMYQVSFYLGVFLILLAAALAVFRGTELLSSVFGGLGIADFVAYFITKPPEALEKSRADLAQLQMAIYTWFNDNYNWNTLLGMEGNKGMVNLEYLKSVSAAMLDSTHKTMSDIEAYCKFVVKPTAEEPKTGNGQSGDHGSVPGGKGGRDSPGEKTNSPKQPGK